MALSPELVFDHLGLVVPALETGRAHLAATLGIAEWSAAIDDPGMGVSVQFGLGSSGPAIELIAPLGESSPVANALRRGQHILNHVAYLTSDLVGSAAILSEHGCVATGRAHPAMAYAGRPVQFFISPLRFMIELIEAPGHRHEYSA